MLSDLHST